MTMIHRTQPTTRSACIGAGCVGVRGYGFGYWFTPGVPVAMS